jgi:hypothetical protein
MSKLHILTPVKDSLDTTLRTIDSIMNSDFDEDFSYTVYNDFSTPETTAQLQARSEELGFLLVNLKDVTTLASPNYLLILQIAQQKALAENAHLMIIESDVMVKSNTIQELYNHVLLLEKPGMIAAVTTDSHQRINFPYLYARNFKSGVFSTRKRLSFCCTVISLAFLNVYDFNELNPSKSWYDVFISHRSIKLGFRNYLMTSLPVLHLPHSSRPWKQLKYTRPIKYYWIKFIERRDKI